MLCDFVVNCTPVIFFSLATVDQQNEALQLLCIISEEVILPHTLIPLGLPNKHHTFKCNKRDKKAGALFTTPTSWLYIVYCSAVHSVVLYSKSRHEWNMIIPLLDYPQKISTFSNMWVKLEVRSAGFIIIGIRYICS